MQSVAERVELDKKDKAELQAIVEALGGKATSRTKKAEMIDMILELSGVTTDGSTEADTSEAESVEETRESVRSGESPTGDGPSSAGSAEAGGRRGDDSSQGSADNRGRHAQTQAGEQGQSPSRRSRRRRGRRNDEPPAEWELEVAEDSDEAQIDRSRGGRAETVEGDTDRTDRKTGSDKSQDGDESDEPASPDEADGKPADKADRSEKADRSDRTDDAENGNRRRRRRGRGKERDDNIDPAQPSPVEVTGYLDLRDDGYGFVRVEGYLPSKEDVYVPVKMVRQFKLRKGDRISGTARAANRNEKNPALQELLTVNGVAPGELGGRPDFEDLTPLFPDERLVLERTNQPLDLTPRIIDLLAPIGKGQRGLIVSPPKAGKTMIMKELAASIEQNHPEVELIVLLVDERPEEVTDMRRHLERGEVVASTFDRPVEEHCAIAELTVERAKRKVEDGKDVVLIVDGITRLARAYNLGASGTGRVMSGGVDAGALYPPKKFLGAARNLEEGGSLTILATALVETGSRMDEVIFEEFKGTGNMELRLDRGLAERMIFPAIDPLGSSTRRSELFVLGPEHHATTKLRRVLAGLAGGEEGTAAAGMNLLLDRLRSFRTNAEFLAEIAKAP